MSQRVSMLCSVSVIVVCFAAVVAARKKTAEVISAANDVNNRYVNPTILKNYKQKVDQKAPDVRIQFKDPVHDPSPRIGGSIQFSITVKETSKADPEEAATGTAVVEDNAGTIKVKSASPDGGSRQAINADKLKAEIERILQSVQNDQ